MAVLVLKPLPKLGWPLQELAESVVHEAKGDQVVYSTSTADLFTLPENTELVGLGFRIDTAYTGAVAQPLIVTDSDANVMMKMGSVLADSNAVPFRFFFKPYSSGMTFSLESHSDLSAGAVTPIILYRMNSEGRSLVQGAFR